MHLDVIPTLRCPREHEESGLVLVADDTRGRHVVSGLLGCPVCEAEYQIREGVAYFAAARGHGELGADELHPTDQSSGARAASTRGGAAVLRTAAMLGLTEPGGVILLGGSWASVADAISEIADALVLVANPPVPASYGQGVSALSVGERLPIASRALRAAAIDEPVEGIAAIVRPKGRLVATHTVPPVPGVTEIARDAAYWVGEVSASPPPPAAPTPLRIARR